MAKFRPGDEVTYCGVICKVASIFRGEAELTTLSGSLIDYFPLAALHKVAKIQQRSILRQSKVITEEEANNR